MQARQFGEKKIRQATDSVKANSRDYAKQKKSQAASEVGVFRDALQNAADKLSEENALTGGLALMLMSTDIDQHAIWLAPLIVGAIIAGIAGTMITTARQTLANASLIPHKTLKTLKEDKQWIQNKVQ